MNTLEKTYPPLPVAVGSARHFIINACKRAEVGLDACETIALLVSEVMTNAVIHGRSHVRIRLSIDLPVVRVEVADDDSRHPHLVAIDSGAVGGRGLHLVDALASRWGFEDHATGKTVWFEVGI